MTDAVKIKDTLDDLRDWPLYLAEREILALHRRGEIGEWLVAEGAINWLREHHSIRTSLARGRIRDLCMFGFGLLTSPVLYVLWTWVVP